MLGTLLMVAVAISMAILAYVWSIGLTGGLMGAGGSQLKEQLIMEAYNWPAGAASFTVTLRNVGTTALTIDAIYVAGILANFDGTSAIPPGSNSDMTVTVGTTSLTDGVAYTLKIVTQTGGVFAFVAIRGSAG